MKIEIDEKILKEATRCENNFKCLKEDKSTLCKVESCFNNELHFIKCADTFFCNYKTPLGNLSICSCPVRRELSNKYGI